jgi:hypothetical protein
MVQALVNLSDEAAYIISLIKAKYALKDKSEAINALAKEYARDNLDFELRPEYVARLRRIEKEGRVRVRDPKKYFSSMRD